MSYYIPLIIIVLSNVMYHICAKGVPYQMNPMVSLLITYFVAGTLTLLMFFLLPDVLPIGNKGDSTLLKQIRLTNWAPIILGIVIVGLEFGNILMYRAGWNISIGSLVSNIALALILLVIGLLVYKENISFFQAAGMFLCISGLVLIFK